MINGKTEYVAIFGNPVAHSLSPQMHNAAFSHLGLNITYLAFRVDEAREAAWAIRKLGFLGASITVPHKDKIIAHLDVLDSHERTFFNEKRTCLVIPGLCCRVSRRIFIRGFRTLSRSIFKPGATYY